MSVKPSFLDGNNGPATNSCMLNGAGPAEKYHHLEHMSFCYQKCRHCGQRMIPVWAYDEFDMEEEWKPANEYKWRDRPVREYLDYGP